MFMIRRTFTAGSFLSQLRRVTRGGGGLPCLFSNLKKSALIWGKNALIRFIYRFNFSFKVFAVSSVSRKEI